MAMVGTCLTVLPSAAPLRAQQAPQAPAPIGASDRQKEIDQRQREMDRLGADIKGSEAAQAKLKSEVDAIKDDRARLADDLVHTARRIQEIEDKLGKAEERLSELDAQEGDIRKSLDARRGVLAEILGGLAKLGRKPPPALLVRPDDALQSVRSAILMGAVLPELRGEAEALGVELADLGHVRNEAAIERDALADLKTSLGADRLRVAALVDQRQANLQDSEQALAAERERAATLGKQAENVRELVERMEKEIASAARAAQEAAKAPETKPEQGGRGNLLALGNTGRLSPAISFRDAKGLLPLPVSGVRLREFGITDGVGGAEKGLSIGTRAEAQVSAPCDGWVVYAGPFRSYGQLLIINAGDGYHILLAGMDRMNVQLGQFVLTGEPVAVMGRGPQLASTAGLGTAQPVLYVEFRKDGVSIDPSSWWAASDSEKVRG